MLPKIPTRRLPEIRNPSATTRAWPAKGPPGGRHVVSKPHKADVYPQHRGGRRRPRRHPRVNNGTYLQLANLHGDIVAEVDLDANATANRNQQSLLARSKLHCPNASTYMLEVLTLRSRPSGRACLKAARLSHDVRVTHPVTELSALTRAACSYLAIGLAVALSACAQNCELNSVEWASKGERRSTVAHHLVACQTLEGLRRREVRRLLGRPDQPAFDEHRGVLYSTGVSGGFGPESCGSRSDGTALCPRLSTTASFLE